MLDISRKGTGVDAVDEESSDEDIEDDGAESEEGEDGPPMSAAKRRRLNPTIPDIRNAKASIAQRSLLTRDVFLSVQNADLTSWLNTILELEWCSYIAQLMASMLWWPSKWIWYRMSEEFTKWADGVAERHHVPTQDSYFGFVVASFLLAHVGFGEFVLSHHCLDGGSRVCYFEKNDQSQMET